MQASPPIVFYLWRKIRLDFILFSAAETKLDQLESSCIYFGYFSSFVSNQSESDFTHYGSLKNLKKNQSELSFIYHGCFKSCIINQSESSFTYRGNFYYQSIRVETYLLSTFENWDINQSNQAFIFVEDSKFLVPYKPNWFFVKMEFSRVLISTNQKSAFSLFELILRVFNFFVDLFVDQPSTIQFDVIFVIKHIVH